MSDNLQHPQVVIHGSLAQNLRGAAGQSAVRERSRSGGQTPRDMVWVDSKERLSEMATDIRGISSALSNVALAVPVSKIVLVTKLNDEELDKKLRTVVFWLLNWSCTTSSNNSGREKWYHGTEQQNKLERASSFSQSREQIFSASPTSSSQLQELRGHKKQQVEWSVEPCTKGNLKIFVEDVFFDRKTFTKEDQENPQYKGRLNTWSKDTVGNEAESIDMVITLGGDGTVLYTSWLFQKMVPPTLSFGLGSLGFMTENEFGEFENVLNDHLTNGICCALRMRFQCVVMRTKNPEKRGIDDLQQEIHLGGDDSHFTSTHTTEGEYTILNEVVIDRGPNPFITMTELYGDYELLTSIKADGVVISTPTGSTAYSMSAGGSLVHPDIPARLISPICPHTLSFRPLVVPDSMALHIGVPYDARSSAFVSFDGKARVELRRGDFLAINVSRYPFPKVLPSNATSVSWVQQLSRTLHWNEQKRPKAFT